MGMFSGGEETEILIRKQSPKFLECSICKNKKITTANSYWKRFLKLGAVDEDSFKESYICRSCKK